MYENLSDEEKMALLCVLSQEEIDKKLNEPESEEDKRIDEYERLKENLADTIPGSWKPKWDQLGQPEPTAPGLDNPELQSAMNSYNDTLRDKVAQGQVTPEQAASTYNLTELGHHFQLSHGGKLDASGQINPNGGTFLDAKIQEAVGVTNALNSELLDSRVPVNQFEAGSFDRFESRAGQRSSLRGPFNCSAREHWLLLDLWTNC